MKRSIHLMLNQNEQVIPIKSRYCQRETKGYGFHFSGQAVDVLRVSIGDRNEGYVFLNPRTNDLYSDTSFLVRQSSNEGWLEGQWWKIKIS